MEDYLGITDYVVLPDISDYGIHHIDCWMKLLSEETILVKEVSPSHPDYDELEANVATLQTLTSCYGRPYEIVRVYCGSIGGSDVAAYTNSMILNDKVFAPLYGISTDSTALATYQAAMPGYEIHGYDGSFLSDDAIHCRSMEIHDSRMLVVDTKPLQDMETNAGPYGVSAYIDDRSETGLVSDSILVYWRLSGESGFSHLDLQATAHPDSYYAEIPLQADSTCVEYYVFARDNSGRRSFRPLVAPASWFSFNTGETDISGIAGGDDTENPDPTEMLAGYPNPFRETAEIRYHVRSPGRIRLEILDVRGRCVATLVDRFEEPGTRSVSWGGTDDRGRRVSPGLYLCRLCSTRSHHTTKLILLGSELKLSR
jgi:hypothetical protein